MDQGSKSKNKINEIDKKELLITIAVLIVAIIAGIIGGWALYEIMYGSI